MLFSGCDGSDSTGVVIGADGTDDTGETEDAAITLTTMQPLQAMTLWISITRCSLTEV